MSECPAFSPNEVKKYTTYAHKAKYCSAQEEWETTHETTRSCSKCFVVKTVYNFAGNTSGADPFDRDGIRLRRPECITCTVKARKGKSKAQKIAKDQGVSYKAPPGETCKICGTDKKLVFDHDHESELFRGYLCNSCNRSMGVLGDNLEGMATVINYILTCANPPNKKLAIEPNGLLKIETSI